MSAAWLTTPACCTFHLLPRCCKATTPPPKNGYFDLFCQQIAKRNKESDFFFYLENHSLACAMCVENGEATRCCHNLHYIPPWKSIARFNAMQELIVSGARLPPSTWVGAQRIFNFFAAPKIEH